MYDHTDKEQKEKDTHLSVCQEVAGIESVEGVDIDAPQI